MARPRKNAVKAQGSLLKPDAVAEIPVEEQPYPLPEGWKWVRLGDASEIVMGQSPSGADTTDDSSYTPLIGGASDMGQLYPEATKYTKCPTKLSNKNDIIVCIRATLGRPIFSNGEYCLGRGVAAVRSNKISSQFTRFLFINFEQYLYDNATGTTFAQVNSDTLKKMPIPLPPLDDQQRIVDRIESLFAKLNDAKAKAEAVLDGFEIRKAAILHKAFTGELTRNVENFSAWKEKSSQKLFTYVTSGSRGWAKYYAEKGAVFIRMGNLEHGTIELDFSDIQYVQLPDKVEGQRSRLQKNDILISITADVGMVGLVRDESLEGYINQHIALARPSISEDAEFIAWYLVSDVGLTQMRKKQRGATKVGLGLDDIRTLRLKMPLQNTQRKIVRILDSLLAKEQQIKEAAENVLNQIDLMKKAILARAFRGELGG